MKIMRILLWVLIFAAFTISCDKISQVKVLKLAHVLDTSHPVHKSMVFMAEKVAKNSGGEMRIDIYPSGQLGGERDLIELLQIGSLAMTKVSTSTMETFVPEMKIFSVPYVFRDETHLWNVLNGTIGRELLLAGEPYFLRGLCYYDAGSRSFYTRNKPIHTPTDLNGLKIRVMKSRTAFEMVRALGGSATPISWGELYTALQQGVVDGAENNPPSFFLSKHYEVCRFYTLDEHTSVPDILLMSVYIWKSLSPLEQKWIQEAIDESVLYERKLWQEASDHALTQVQKAGVEIIYPDKENFRNKVKPLMESYRNTKLWDLMTKIEKVD